jgi:hypothetical protein
MQSTLMNDENIGLFEKALTLSMNTDYSLGEGTRIATFTFRVLEDGLLSDMIEMNSSITKAEAYVGEQYIKHVIDLSTQSEERVFALGQNVPNPFNSTTEINFTLPERSAYSLKFFDLNGKSILTINGMGESGKNSVLLNSEQFNISGMIYYKLESNQMTDTKHMVLLK